MPTHLHEKLVELTSADSPYTASVTRNIICNTSGGDITVNLPTVSGNTGLRYEIRNTSTGLVTIDGNGSETVKGDATQVLYEGEDLVLFATSGGWV